MHQLLGYVVGKARYAVREPEAVAAATAEKANKKPLSLRAASLQLAVGTIVETRNCGPLSGQRGVVVGCFFKQKTAYEILRSDWSSDVCSSD
eukprot:COSAG01_NODE_22350_length_859_cov_1.513158_1_plen_91_part_01